MNRSIVLVVFFISFFSKAYSSFQPYIGNDSSFYKMEIIEIIKNKNAYIIYTQLEKDSSLIAIVTFKKRCKNGEKMKIGKTYTIRIFPYYKDDIVPNHSILFVIKKDGGKVKVPSTGWMSNVYTSPDLQGLKICTIRT